MRSKKRPGPQQATKAKAPGEPELAKFREWSERYSHVWSHVRVTALAYNLRGAWVCRSLAVVLTDQSGARFPTVQTDQIRIVERYLPITQLWNVIGGVTKGALAPATSPTSERLQIANGDSTPFRQVWGRVNDPEDHRHRRTELGAFQRYRMEWRGEGNLAAFFDTPGKGSEWLETARRKFLSLHQGTLDEVAIRFGLAESQSQLYWDQPAFANLIAPIYLAFTSIEQSADAASVEVTINKGSRLRSRDVVVALEQTSSANDRVQRAVAPGEKVTFRTPDARKATFQLTYCGESVDRFSRTIESPIQANARLEALRAMETGNDFLEAGIDQVQRDPKKRDEDAFERSVAHFLGLLGFSVFWWGPHRGPMPVPTDDVDLHAWSADDRLLLLVECTLQPSQDLKTVKLIRRTKQVSTLMSSRLGDASPHIEPVLVVGVPRAEIAKQLAVVDGSEVTVVALDEIRSALTGMKQGRSREQVVADLPEKLAMGYAALPRTRIWPGDLWGD